ncbi:sodium:proton antiporter [Salinisphaera sp. LB1]|uniref:cation:proton antiporter n=1 Tax=Salinisphaera sp. LB1 TaxID=2183911 RepID=UPI000D707532|nr:cation:proton antiporter [Salinisphaera sp. LB1]AWN14946.1 Na+/H+ antiporter [Salinisphaera sp. LB1]
MESNPAIETAQHVLLIFGVVLSCGSFIGFFAQKIKMPDIVLFLLVGILLGPEISGVVDVPTGSALNQIILIFGASYILFDGGAETHLSVVKGVWISLLLLVTVGVLITALVVAPVAQYLFGIPFMVALLLGATIAPTDPATLMPVFKQVSIRRRVAQTVVSESAFNDATGSIIVVTLMSVLAGSGHLSYGHALLDLLEQSVIGIIAGALLGFVSLFVIAHEKYSFLREYMPLVTLMAVIGAYLGAVDLQASGFMAAFVAGVVIGNRSLFGYRIGAEEQRSLHDFVGTTALIMRMFIFILLGSQVKFSLLAEHWVGALIVVAVFMFVARPLNVFLCTLPDRRAKWTFKELLFMSWVRETGVIPSALAGILLGENAPHAHLIASVVFVAVLVTILAQATTTRWWAGKLDLLEE